MRPRGRIAVGVLVSCCLLLAGVACGGGGGEAETTTGAAATEPGAGTTALPGDPQQGMAVFDDQGCGNCHTLEAANASGTVGPNLDEQLAESANQAGKPLADFTRESIVSPDDFVAEGFSAGVMPQDFGDRLSDEQLNDLVAFIVQSVTGQG